MAAGRGYAHSHRSARQAAAIPPPSAATTPRTVTVIPALRDDALILNQYGRRRVGDAGHRP